jgi:hypothetical protein
MSASNGSLVLRYDEPVFQATPRSAEWWHRDAEYNEQVRRARLRRDTGKPPGRNLEEGSELVRFAHEFAAAFDKARRED